MRHFEDDNHALATGMLFAAFGVGVQESRMDSRILQDKDAMGNYESRLLVETPVGLFWLQVVPFVEPAVELLELRSRLVDGG